MHTSPKRLLIQEEPGYEMTECLDRQGRSNHDASTTLSYNGKQWVPSSIITTKPSAQTDHPTPSVTYMATAKASPTKSTEPYLLSTFLVRNDIALYHVT
jgi:hypothetical protein